MPIYEYQCSDCGEHFEKLVRSMVNQESIACPECGGVHVSKAISLFGALSGGSSRGAAAAQSCAPSG